MSSSKNKWSQGRAFTVDEWKGHTVYVVCDNLPVLDTMTKGFWKMLYGERVIGIGKVVKEIGERSEHKGQFMKVICETESAYAA